MLERGKHMKSIEAESVVTVERERERESYYLFNMGFDNSNMCK